MYRYLTYDKNKQGDFVYGTMVIFSLLLISFGFVCDTPRNIFDGVIAIVRTQAGLITDSIVVGGLGAAFVNSGLVTLISIVLLRLCKLTFSGISVAALFLMAGFALFGKDVYNIFPIILGGFLYSRYQHEHFGRYIYISLFGTALAPIVTEMRTITADPTLSFLLTIGMGILIGFLLPPIAAFTMRVHQGYNLYNVGFTAGLIGMVMASLFRSMGRVFETRFEWSSGNNAILAIFLFTLFLLMVVSGWAHNGCSFKGVVAVTRHSGRAVADFVLLDDYPVTLINMGIVGAFATVYVLVVGGSLNGPTIGGILSICGFGAFGKHLRNIIPVMAGVVLSSFFMVWRLSDPDVLLAALFSTGLAPIAGQFGWKWGVIAGVVHASVVLNVGFLHGGLNLYNNGFAAGLVCIVLIPLIEALQKKDAFTG
ncbi:MULTISPECIES: DUF1576 domain-containing protein [Anaerotruncus]|uniref:DUF1576 domain-containing protein n=1 Tax=Anaerotruncus TaxID=244127 RepID=UPI0008318687|nr:MULTISPECIES: DUF1576 domain-containing protein [Anaerotruncus]